MSTPACVNCNDTGSASKKLWGDLDCTHCDAPAVRMSLRKFIAEKLNGADREMLAWACYLHGRSEANK